MGNRALSAAVQYISMSMPKLLAETYFKYALLMAADEDNNAFCRTRQAESAPYTRQPYRRLNKRIRLCDAPQLFGQSSSAAGMVWPGGLWGAPQQSGLDRLLGCRRNLREQWGF